MPQVQRRGKGLKLRKSKLKLRTEIFQLLVGNMKTSFSAILFLATAGIVICSMLAWIYNDIRPDIYSACVRGYQVVMYDGNVMQILDQQGRPLMCEEEDHAR